jgi:hypothetical protein
MRAVTRAAFALAWCWLCGAHAQDRERGREQESGPDLDFLEYLGAWAEADDEWLAVEELRKDAAAGAEKDTAESESETERDDDHESK